MFETILVTCEKRYNIEIFAFYYSTNHVIMILSVENDNAQSKNFASDDFEFVKESMKSFVENEKFETLETLLRALNENRAFWRFIAIDNYFAISTRDASNVYLACNWNCYEKWYKRMKIWCNTHQNNISFCHSLLFSTTRDDTPLDNPNPDSSNSKMYSSNSRDLKLTKIERATREIIKF